MNITRSRGDRVDVGVAVGSYNYFLDALHLEVDPLPMHSGHV